MKKGIDQTKAQISSPNNIIVSVLTADMRENSGVRATGELVYFYDTYFTDVNHFSDIVGSLSYESGKGVSNISVVSIDSIFSPYSTLLNSSGDFPSFQIPTSTSLDATSLYLNPFNPLNIFGTGTPVNVVNSGSGANSGMIEGFAQQWMDSGHNIMMAAVGSGLGNPSGLSPSGSGYNNNPHSFVFDTDFEARAKVETRNIRAIGMRAPMVLSGWGFDVNGVPTQTENFHDPRTWKTGPVDLRWDDDRGVWTGGTQVKIYLVKMTNAYNPACFSYEVDRATSRAQYTRNTLSPRQYSSATGTLPSGINIFPETGIYDPEYLAYTADSRNSGCFEALNYSDGEYPYYEAYIIRETNLDPIQASVYNIWTDDCQDCGHVSNRCTTGTNHGGSATNKKILIENPLRDSFDVGDLAFTVNTGRKKQVYSGGFINGSGIGASGRFTTDSNGNLSFTITNSGSGYTAGAFALYDQPCVGLTLYGNGNIITSGTIDGETSGYLANQIYNVTIIPKNATSATEELPIHWVLKQESKTVQVNTWVGASAGILQSCTTKISFAGSVLCEHCGEDSTLINSFI